MRISLFTSEFDQRPEGQDGTWDDLKLLLSTCRDTKCAPCPSLRGSEHKCEHRKGIAWSPSIFTEVDAHGKGWRGDANVIGADLITLDCDHLTQTDVATLDAGIERLGWAAIIHSTHSHRPDDVCLRVVFRCTRRMTHAEIKPTRDWVQAQLGMRADEKTKNEERLYYLPSRSVEAVDFVFISCEGTEIEPVATFTASLLDQVRADARGSAQTTAAPSGAQSFPERTEGNLKALRHRLARNTDERVIKMLAGEKIAEQGHRDGELNKLASKVAFALGDASIEALIELCRPSFAKMGWEVSGWVDEYRDMLQRACERKAEEDARHLAISQARVMSYAGEANKAFPDEPTDDPTDDPNAQYTPEKMLEWAKAAGCATVDDFKKLWIIRFHGAHWVFCNGRYASGVPDKDLEISLRRDLARAPVALMTSNAKGEEVPRKLSLVLYDHATPARSVQASIALRASRYDSAEQCFHEAVCPIRWELKPKEHPEIDQWLRLFGGEVLLDWVSCITRLDKPAAALYIEGPPGTGKNVLADGLARLWHKGGASAFKDVIGTNFNDSLTRCPLIHADEGIPKTDTIIDDLRRLLGSGMGSLNRKFMPVVSLDGNPRLLITANNNRVLLDTGAQLGPHDIEAVAARIRQLKASPEAVTYLAALRKTHGHGYIERWIKDDHVARHALWLSETRKIDETGRFLVAGHDVEQAELMITGTGQVGAVMEFLARYLSDTTAMSTPKIRTGGGLLLVNTEALADEHQWKRYVPSRHIPSAKQISGSLAAVSEVQPLELDGFYYFAVKTHMLLNWARTSQVGSVKVMEAKINGN